MKSEIAHPVGPHLTDAVRAVCMALRAAYGPPPPQVRQDLLDTLIRTILSQNTTGANSRRAFSALKRRFESWEDCLEAPRSSVMRAVRSAGLGHIRAGRIQEILRRVLDDHGVLSLEVLHNWPTARAMAYLESLPGVGPKTAACALLFGSRRRLLPVDTHVARIVRRLAWASNSASPETIQKTLEPLVPPGLRYSLHVHLVAHGRSVCRPTKPGCAVCVIRSYCRAGAEVGERLQLPENSAGIRQAESPRI